MKTISGYHDELKCGISTTYGVYSQAGWEMLHDKAFPISLHSFFDAAVAAATRDEINGHPRVVVRFDSASDEGAWIPDNSSAWRLDVLR